MAKKKKPEKEKLETIIGTALVAQRAQHRKIVLPSYDVGTYDTETPTITPDSTDSAVTISELERIYWTNPIVNKAVNIRANRLLGEGFYLEPSNHPGAKPYLAKLARNICEIFLKGVGGNKFVRQSAINAYVAGNEWTEMIPNLSGVVISLSHGDFKTIDFRRDFLYNKILLGSDGNPVGYWQRIENLAELHNSIETLFGSKETLENLEAARERLEGNENYEIKDEEGNVVGMMTKKPMYMFLKKSEIVHLSFNNLNDNAFGTSLILPAYNAIIYYERVMNAVSEYINMMGYPKLVAEVGNDEHPPNDNELDQAESLVQDPLRKESYAVSYLCKLSYLMPQNVSADINNYIGAYLTAIAIGLRTPRELLTGEGLANRSTSEQASSDFDLEIMCDRETLENYLKEIFHYVLESREFASYGGTIRNAYIPEIKWKTNTKEKQALSEKMVYEKWEKGLISFNEAREYLELPEIEDRGRGDAYYEELTGGKTGGDDFDKYLKDATQTGKKEEVMAQHRLMNKDALNDELNREYGTEDVDYKEIATKDFGKKIKTVSKEKARQIRDAVVNGEAEGKPAKSILEKVMEIGGYDTSEALRVIRTERTDFLNEAKLEQARGKGYAKKTWIAVMDSNTSPLCKSLNGKTVGIDENFKTRYKTKNGKIKSWEGQRPASHVNCRCRLEFTEGE